MVLDIEPTRRLNMQVSASDFDQLLREHHA